MQHNGPVVRLDCAAQPGRRVRRPGPVNYGGQPPFRTGLVARLLWLTRPPAVGCPVSPGQIMTIHECERRQNGQR